MFKYKYTCFGISVGKGLGKCAGEGVGVCEYVGVCEGVGVGIFVKCRCRYMCRNM